MSRITEVTTRLSLLTAALALLLAVGAQSRLAADDQEYSAEDEASGPIDPAEAFGMDRLFVPRWRLTDGPQMRAAFRDVIRQTRKATVCIHCDKKHATLGGIISSDGWIVTKATPLCGKQTVILQDGKELEAKTVAVSGEYDLALLKVDATSLPALDLGATQTPDVGSWLATVGRSQDPVAIGVVSVPPRQIPPQAGILGVELDEIRAKIVRVFPESAALEAGLKAQDVILQVNGINTPTREKLKAVVSAFNPGDKVELVVNRGGQQLNIEATLSGDFPGMMGRSDFQNNLGGKLSVRRFGFPLAFQHDTVLRPADCGGPVVDIDGRVVGLNIARSGRTESYALPASTVREVTSKLMKENLLVGAHSPEASPSAAPKTTQ